MDHGFTLCHHRIVHLICLHSTFFLAWIVLPIQMEYHSSGHFTFYSKVRWTASETIHVVSDSSHSKQMKDAFMRLALAALLALAAGIFYIIYMVSTSGGSLYQVVGFMMAMGNTYGVLLITVLLGNGLVALPKRLWTMANIDGELQRLYMSVSIGRVNRSAICLCGCD